MDSDTLTHIAVIAILGGKVLFFVWMMYAVWENRCTTSPEDRKLDAEEMKNQFNAHWDSQWEDPDMSGAWFWVEARRLFCKARTLSSESFFDYPWEHITQGHRFDGIGRPLLNKPRTHRDG